MKRIIVASTSSLHAQGYLEYLNQALKDHFATAKTVLFIPYARPGGITHEAYTQKAATYFKTINKSVIGIHNCSNAKQAILEADAIFTGGGNTFVLVQTLHNLALMEVLRQAILNGTPYLGTSAGSNICGPTMQTTNDMPIVFPKSFKTLGVIPFNINPHYLDPDPTGTHMGETRETRLKEFHAYNNLPVVGLREGSWLDVRGSEIELKGELTARIFKANSQPFEADSSYHFGELS